jgi:hypothetical protein
LTAITAFGNNSSDPDILYHYATLLPESSDSVDLRIRVLQKAIELRPAFKDAQFALGLAPLNARKYALAFISLSQLKSVARDRAFTLCSLRSRIVNFS